MVAKDFDRQREVLQAAESVFARYGYHETGVRAIADEAHCAVGTFYLYFSSKTDCFLALIDALYGKVMDSVVVRRAELKAPEEKLKASVEAVVGVLLKERNLARLVLVQTAGSEPWLENHLWHIHDTFATLLATELEECGLGADEAKIGAWAWVGALAEIFNLWARDPELALEDMASAVGALFWKGWGLAMP